MSIRRLNLLCLLLTLPCSITLAASFDCAKASTPTEKAICASPALGQLDQDVALAYKSLLKSLDGEGAQSARDEQREWIKTRDASGALDASLRARLSALREALALLPTPTDNAFDALLSMPTAKPAEGEWDTVAPDDFSPDDEAGLIRYLALQVKRGADVNEYRHDGTLLHHAIRAGLAATSRWLLAHGADPGKHVQGDKRDALMLAIDYGRPSLFEALLKSPHYARLAPRELALAVWPTALASPVAIKYLLEHKFPMPDGEPGQCMLENALTKLNFKLLQALPERTPLRIDIKQSHAEKGVMATLRHLCMNRDDDYYSTETLSPTKLAALSTADLEAADARITAPFLPYLLPAVVTSEDAQRLFRINLKRPFGQAAFTTRVLKAALRLPYAPGVTPALLRPIAPDALRSVLDNDTMLNMWFHRFRGESPSDFAWALDVPSAAMLNAHASAVLKGMALQDYKVGAAALANTWPMLLARLRGPLGPSGDKANDPPKLLEENMPVSSWAQLFKLGYRPMDNELDSALRRITPAELRQAWPVLAAALPALSAHVVERLLAPYLPGQCDGAIGQVDVDKVKFLLAQGVRASKPLTLCARAKEGAQKAYAELFATGIVAPAGEGRQAAGAASRPIKLVAEHKLQCRIEVNDAVRSAMAGGELGADERVKIDDVQAIDFPGDPRCALVVSGNSLSYFNSDDEQPGSFDAGPTPEPHPSCPDSTFIKQVWRLREGKIDVSDFDVNFYTKIEAIARDPASGRRYFVATEYHGKCGQDKTYLAAWTNEGGHQQLKAIGPDAPAARAFESQCAKATDTIDCFGESTRDSAETTLPGWSSQRFQDFVNAQFTPQRNAFVKAVMAMDKPQLQADLKAGIFASWRLAAMAQVSASKLDQQQKRQRMAWLLDSPERAIEVMRVERGQEKNIDPFGLIVTWLPESTWDALITKINGGSSLLDPLRSAATAQGQHALACRLSKEFQRSCRTAKE